MERTQRIAILQKIMKGEATPEDLKDRRLVLRITGKMSGIKSGLYMNGVITNDPEHLAEFSTAFKNRQVKFNWLSSSEGIIHVR